MAEHPNADGRTENKLLVAEYSALRDEIMLLEQEQFRSLRYAILAAGVIAAWVLLQREGLGVLSIPVAFLPLLILRAASVWMGRLGVTIERIGQYLRTLEAQAAQSEIPGWQHYKAQKGFERLDHWDHAARYLRALNVFSLVFGLYVSATVLGKDQLAHVWRWAVSIAESLVRSGG